MRVAVDINHPAHVHFFRNLVAEMRAAGHQVRITASEKDKTFQLLDDYGLEYVPLPGYGRTTLRKVFKLPVLGWRTYRALKDFRPDLVLGLASVRAAHAAKLLGTRCINFDDSEHARWEVRLYLPFVEAVCTPSCYKRDLGPKHLRYAGYQELAYLHPSRFRPDPAVLSEAGIAADEPLVVIRFVSWQAVHDVGQMGFSAADRLRLARELEKRARVIVVSEAPLGPEFDAYRMPVAPEKIHHLLAYARLYVGEGATMATEAGILGTPSLYVSSLVGTMGNFEELMTVYDLVHAYRTAEEVFGEAVRLVQDPSARRLWQEKRQKMLAEKIDVTQWVLDLVLSGAST